MDLALLKAEAKGLSDGVVSTDTAVRRLAALVALLIEALEQNEKGENS